MGTMVLVLLNMIKTLQIEDSKDYRLIFKALTRRDLDITVVESLAELYALPKELLSEFKVVILDGQLPDGTGMQALKFLENNQLSPLVIANSSSDDYNKLMTDLGAKYSLKKDKVQSNIAEVLNLIKSECSL